jgi:putative ABC transport system permease protein
VAPQVQANSQVVAGNKNTFTQIVGVTPEFSTVRNYPVATGEYLTWAHVQEKSEVAVLGSLVAETLFGFRDPVGQSVRIGRRPYRVIGVLQSKGGSGLGNEDNQVHVPITTAAYRLSSRRTPQGDVAVQAINVQAAGEDSMDAAVQELATVLRLRHRLTGEDDFTITSQQETLDALEQTTNTFVVFLGAIAGISLLVGGIGVMNIMLVSVTERTREIGLRKALGAKRRDILLQFVAEAVFLTVLGGGLGVLGGLALTGIMDGRQIGGQTFQTVFSVDIALLALVVSVGIGLFFGIYPAMRAAALHPIEALRHD